MAYPDDDPSPAVRAAVAFASLAFATFFGAILVLVLRAPFEPGTPWWAEWSIRVFGVLIFGGMAALGLYGFVVSVRGPREPPFPAPLLVRCPACGERILPTTSCCPGCRRSPGQVGRAWREAPRDSGSGVLLGACLGGGMLALGVLLAGYALSGEEGWLLSIAYGGLGLLLMLVGGAMVYGGLVAFRDAYRLRGRRSFTLSLTLDGADITATADITPDSALLRGATVTRRALEQAPERELPDAPAPPALRSFVRTIAVLHARGEASLTIRETLEWTAGADDDPTRLNGVDGEVCTRSPGIEASVPAHAYILYALDDDVGLRDVVASLPDHPQLRNAFETYAAQLSADDADPRTVRILSAVLAGGGWAGAVPAAGLIPIPIPGAGAFGWGRRACSSRPPEGAAAAAEHLLEQRALALATVLLTRDAREVAGPEREGGAGSGRARGDSGRNSPRAGDGGRVPGRTRAASRRALLMGRTPLFARQEGARSFGRPRHARARSPRWMDRTAEARYNRAWPATPPMRSRPPPPRSRRERFLQAIPRLRSRCSGSGWPTSPGTTSGPGPR